MKGLLVVALCTVYSVQAWHELLGPLHIEGQAGNVPQKYFPLSANDKHATKKANTFVNFIKLVPQVNPLKVPALGPYHVSLPDVNFQGDLELSNVAVSGIKGLSLSGLELRMNPSRIDGNISVPSIVFTANFDMKGILKNQAINVNGQVSGKITNLVVSGAVSTKVAQVGQSEVFQMEGAQGVVDLSQLELDMNMSQHAEEFRQIVVQFLKHTNQYAGIVGDLVKAGLSAVSRELTRITAKEILQYLLGSARPSLSG